MPPREELIECRFALLLQETFAQYTYILENVIYAAALTNNDDEKKDTLHAYLAPQGVKFLVCRRQFSSTKINYENSWDTQESWAEMFVFGLSFQSHLTNQPSREEERERLGRKVSTLLGSTNSILHTYFSTVYENWDCFWKDPFLYRALQSVPTRFTVC